jgi:hypothetical protein
VVVSADMHTKAFTLFVPNSLQIIVLGRTSSIDYEHVAQSRDISSILATDNLRSVNCSNIDLMFKLARGVPSIRHSGNQRLVSVLLVTVVPLFPFCKKNLSRNPSRRRSNMVIALLAQS